MITHNAILGAAWGDEGKGHIAHHYSSNYQWLVRFNGGANAGHTIYRNNKKYVHNLLPSVDYSKKSFFNCSEINSFLGSGMVIDLEQLAKEIGKAEEDFPGVASTIYVDPDAFIVLNSHKDEDKAKNGHIGSTNRGIGPAYAAKIERRGLRIKDVLAGKVPEYQSHLDFLIKNKVNFKHVLELSKFFKSSNILFEGAQGVMLDINHGIYPYVSCSDATISGIYANGFNFAKLNTIFGVVKCYTTKVGEGPFPTEIAGEEEESLRVRGNEYGATTGRPRRVGWLDLPALKYACDKGGITHLVMTKFDILNGMSKVPVCVAYDKEPVCPNDFFTAKPQFINLPGWVNAKETEQLEEFISLVQKITERPVYSISCGTSPNDIIQLR
jgi:adenylosuccinate synthase